MIIGGPTDFRGTGIEPGDVIVYVGRQDLKSFLVEARVKSIRFRGTAVALLVEPLRSSDPLARPLQKNVWLKVLRKVTVLRKRRRTRQEMFRASVAQASESARRDLLACTCRHDSGANSDCVIHT